MGELAELPNLGKISAMRLEAVGIRSRADLEDVGAVVAYRRVESLFPLETSVNLLWALEAALWDITWLDLPESRKDELRALLNFQAPVNCPDD